MNNEPPFELGDDYGRWLDEQALARHAEYLKTVKAMVTKVLEENQ